MSDLRLDGVSYERTRLSGEWSLFYPPQDHAYFHFVVGRGCWLMDSEGRWQVLNSGDALLMPRGSAHVLASAPDLPSTHHLARERVQFRPDTDEERSVGADQASTFFCGSMRFHFQERHPVLVAMPEILRARDLVNRDPFIEHLIDAMSDECASTRLAADNVLTRIADVLAVQIVRAWMEQAGTDALPWYAAIRDPQMRRALTAIHTDPARAWTVAELATVVGLSRSSFAMRFTSTVGCSPLRYVTGVQMHLARRWLVDEGARISEVAHRLGFDSEGSFSRTFKRALGDTPGRLRRSNRD